MDSPLFGSKNFFRRWSLIVSLISVFFGAPLYAQEANAIILPTENRALFTGEYEKFFMYVDRNFENQQTTPWEGGQYGFVRGPVRLGQRVLLRSFHEGIDIAPLKRDARGEPLDEILAVSDGKVVYALDRVGASNYGKYIVIEHQWGEGPIYSLYAHLSKLDVKTGDTVKQGQKIGIMGHTGDGLDRRRSHLHLELNLFISRQFEHWHKHYFGNSPNHHGLFNGLNLSGLNVTDFYLARQKNPVLKVSEFVRSQQVSWKVRIPKKGEMELLKLYPWLATAEFNPQHPTLELWFSDSGLPIGIASSDVIINQPRLSFVKNEGLPYTYGTKGMIEGSGERPVLSARGLRFIDLVMGKQDYTK